MRHDARSKRVRRRVYKQNQTRCSFSRFPTREKPCSRKVISVHNNLSAGMTMADVHLDRKYAAVRTARCLLCKDTANMSRGGLPSVQGPTSLKIQLCVCSKSPLYVDFELNFVALRPRRTDFTVPQHYRHVRSLEVSASGGHATVPGSGSPQIVEPFRPRSGGEIWGKNAGKRWRNASLCGITCSSRNPHRVDMSI